MEAKYPRVAILILCTYHQNAENHDNIFDFLRIRRVEKDGSVKYGEVLIMEAKYPRVSIL